MPNMSIFCCCSEGISMSSVFSCTTQMCFQMKCSVTPRCHLSRHLEQDPQKAKWLKFRDQEIVRLQFLENIPEYYRDGLFTPAELLKHLSIFWSIGRTSYHYLSEFTVLLPGLWLWESANCKYTCRSQHTICSGLSHLIRYIPLWMTQLYAKNFVLTPLGHSSLCRNLLQKIYWNLQQNVEIPSVNTLLRQTLKDHHGGTLIEWNSTM